MTRVWWHVLGSCQLRRRQHYIQDRFLGLFFESIFLFIFGGIDNTQPWHVALLVPICFSTLV
jgi:hypothetical protein